MFCPDCGSEVAEGRKFCGKCGGQIHAAAVDIEATQNAAPQVTAAPTPRQPISPRQMLIYALVALLVVLVGAGWWWIHRPAPAYKVQDPGIYPFQSLSADGKTVKWGFIDADGKVLIQPEWDKIATEKVLGQPVAFSEGLCGVLKDGKWGYIDTSGKLVITNQFDSAGPFVEGLAKVNLGNQIGFIGKNGGYVINPQFYEAGDFHDGLAAVRVDGGWGFINKAGSFAIKPQFQSVDINGFSEGLAAVCPAASSLIGIFAGKCGYINRTGTFAIKPQFDGASTFSEGMASVKVNNKWGYINTSGNIVINPQFDGTTMFSGGLAVVAVAGNGSTGTINTQGKYVLNPQRYNMQLRESDLQSATTTSDGTGLLTRDVKWVVKSKAISSISMIMGKVFYAIVGGQSVVISTSGKVLTGLYKGAMLDSLAQDIDNEKSALKSMRALMVAESNYSNAYPNKGYPGSLDKLGPAQGKPDENHAGFIDAALAAGTKDGYQFTVSIPSGANIKGINLSFALLAKPLAGHAGRTLCNDPTVELRPGSAIYYSMQGEVCSGASPIAVGY